jgi:hypothetical protein
LGYERLTEVAVANALEVCPEGKEGLPAFDFLVISGYVINGLSLFIEYFKAFVTPAFNADAMAVTHAFLNNTLSCFINPVTAIPTGTPVTMKASEFETNLKKLSEGSASDELNDLNNLMSMF